MRILIAGVVAVGWLASAAAVDLDRLARPSAFDLELGRHASELSAAAFGGFACGTNGGTPSLPIASFTAFGRCVPEPSGWHEVHFRYDDEREYVARAHALPHIESHAGTKEFERNVIVSGLFDAQGILRGVRVVTDPRVPVDRRMEAYTLGDFLVARYRIDDSDCRDIAPGPGETPVGPTFVKRECAKPLEGGRSLTLRIEHFRKAGQSGLAAGSQNRAELRSEARLDLVYAPDPAADQATLARIAQRAATPEAGVAAQDCPACDLRGAQLKRSKLAGVNLRGADLTGANLHGADLRGADLSDARLDDANLNTADLRHARLDNASLKRAMLFAARLDGARLAGGDLTEALMGQVQLTGASLTRVRMQSADLRGARLADADLSGANLSGSRLDDARAPRANLALTTAYDAVFARARLRGARLNEAKLAGADLSGADLAEADLTAADLTDADLGAAILTGTKREGTTWSGARMPDGTLQAR